MDHTTQSPLNGWLIIDKPAGLSSAAVVSRVKYLTKAKRVGHGGTLDPLATGILPIAIGEATKTVSYAMDGKKAYRFGVAFGTARDTDDSEGEVIATSPHIPSESEIEAVLPQFVGEISQRPPVYSALKKQGKRACDLAREGKPPEMVPRQITIDALRLCDYDPNEGEATLEVACGKGTYVRAIGRDIGEAVGSFAYVSWLRRTRVGKFDENHAISLETLEEIVHTAQLDAYMHPVVAVLDDIPAVTLSPELETDLRHGKVVSIKHLGALPAIHPGATVKALCGGKLVAFATYEEGRLKSVRGFNL
ncbi:MAG: truB [Rickettsiales bacterium]|nr:truB [Rickettsiales bacterium]